MKSGRWKAGVLAAGVLLVVLGIAGYPYYRLAVAVRSAAAAALPYAADWTDYGLVIDAFPFGEGWDVLFEGGTPAGLVRRGDLFYLYYIGADDYIADKDNIGPAHRAIGVATSPDGIHWTKYPSNPVVTRPAQGRPEAGAVTAGVYVDEQGTFHMYYGANEPDPAAAHAVHAEVRYATSPNGFTFTDRGAVLRFDDRRVWGAGDELHAQIAWQQDGRWQVFYVPNGVPAGGKLGVAWGRDPLHLDGTAGVLAGFGGVSGGVGSLVPLNDATLALFLTRGNTTEVRLAARETPWLVSAPVRTYPFDSFGNVVFLDQARRTWFMIYDHWSYMGLRLAPAGDVDRSPPTAPDDLVVAFPAGATAQLRWSPSQDPETGVVAYDVYRDGNLLGTTLETAYSDGPLAELQVYDYQVRAENFHGTLGPSATRTVTAPADTQAAGIGSVAAGVDPFRLEVTFTEPVDRSSAERPASYALPGALGLREASLAGDGRTVLLTTDRPMADTAVYTLTVQGVLDRAQSPNPTFAHHTFTFSAAPGLRAYYPLDGDARDLSGGGSHGAGQGPLAWSEGAIDRSLVLDGLTYVEIDHTPDLDDTFLGSHTLMAWARPAALPPDTSASNGAYTLFSGPTLRLDYDAAGQFVAQLWTASGEITFASTPVSPGRWTHVAVVVDADRQRVGLFLDGAPVAGSPVAYSGPLARLPTPGTGVMAEYLARYRIGIHRPRFSYETNAFVGQLDDVRVYGQALPAEAIAALFRLGAR